ncbi:hypothetical protein [Aquicoccus sp. SU-CL01552]|uniref:hypothetical protein n=1 Tax=Aquicoccus sp. SU-CL01552 TaxID=3127656 RepID=UPI00310A7045
MFGVVLWCNTFENKAVIWCEDQGDLAYYRRLEESEPMEMDAGDLVQFEVTTGCDMRLAHNPRLVAEGVFGGLADRLKGANTPAAPGASTGCTTEIVRLETAARNRRRPDRA